MRKISSWSMEKPCIPLCSAEDGQQKHQFWITFIYTFCSDTAKCIWYTVQRTTKTLSQTQEHTCIRDVQTRHNPLLFDISIRISSIDRLTIICGNRNNLRIRRRYDMNGRFEMQGGTNWIFPKEMNANRFFWDSHWLEIWSNHFCPSIGPNRGIVAMASV